MIIWTARNTFWKKRRANRDGRLWNERRAGREARRKAFPKLCEAEDERGRVRQRIDDIIRKANEGLDRQK